MKRILAFLVTLLFVFSSFSFLSLGAEITTEDSRIKEIQQYLNENYSKYISYIPVNGVPSPYMCKALILALQALEGLPTGTANGIFGPTTQKHCPTIPYEKIDTAARYYNSEKFYTDAQIKDFTQLLQMALYVNGFDPGDFNGNFDTRTVKAITDFKAMMGMKITPKADLTTWLTLLTAPGDTSRSAEAADTATILDKSKADYLYSEGYRYIGRYLTNASKGFDKAMTREEAEIILASGMNFFPIYQTAGTSYSYFTAERGTEDAVKAMDAAFKLGLPKGTVIYFAVDFDATRAQINGNILTYFKKISERMNSGYYKVGVYGSRGVCRTVSEKGYADFSFVSSLSSAHYGNSGFKMPENWTFNQFMETTVKGFGIDRNDFSGRDEGVSCLLEPHSHSYSSSVTKAPTCTKAGTRIYKCGCGDSYTVSVSKTGHTPVKDKAVAPTYKKTGKTEGSHCKVCGDIITAQKTVERKKLGKVKEVKASKTTTSYIKLTWKKVTGAEGYKVSYSTDGKKWKTVKTDKTSLTVKKLKTGQSYRFKVRATAGSNQGAWSSVLKTATKVGKVTVKSLKSSKSGTLTATWSRLSGANGYQIYLSTSKKFTTKTTKKVTVKKNKTVKVTVKSLKKKKTYYVKLRGYKTVNDKKVYGAFSAVKSIKIK